MSKYLITGAAGFIGSHLADLLLSQGHDVVSLDNLDGFYSSEIKESNLNEVKKTAKKFNQTFDDIRGDIRDKEVVKNLFTSHKIKGVFHLAALAGVRPSIEDPVRYWDVNCTGTAVLLEEVKKQGIKQFVFASSSSVYGNCKTAPFSEDLFVGSPISPYAATKRSGELLCHHYSHLEGIHTICIRFFTVYGPRQRPDLAIHKFCKLIEEEKPLPFFGDGTTERDYTYVTDICAGLVSAMEYSQTCPYDIINLGESNTISLSKLIQLLEQNLKKKATLNKLPLQPGDVTRTWADISHAADKLGYKPQVNKEEGLKLFVEWLKAETTS